MRSSIALSSTALLCGACTSEDLIFVRPGEVPADIEWVMGLAEDETGTLIASTPIVRWDELAALRMNDIGRDDTWIVELAGFTDNQLLEMSAPPEDTLERSRIIEARGCDPRVAEPRFRSRFYVNGDPAPEAAQRALTATWLSSTCPQVGGKHSIDVRCLTQRCAGSFTMQEGCTLFVNMENCARGQFTARIDWAGRLCGETSSKPNCTFVPPADPSLARLSCPDPEACEIDVYDTEQPRLFEVDVISAVRGAVMDIPMRLPMLGLRSNMRYTGYIYDIEVIGDRIAVATHDGRFQHEPQCHETGPSRLLFLDTDTLAEVATATTPPCLNQLLAVPGGRLLGVFSEGAERVLATFDLEGRVLDRYPIALENTAERNYAGAGALLTLETNEVVLLFNWADVAPVRGSVLIAISLDTWVQRTLFLGPTRDAWSMVETADGVITFVDDDTDNLLYVRTTTGQTLMELVTVPHVASVSLGHVAYHADTAQVALAIPFEEQNIYLATTDGVSDFAAFFEQDAGPVASIDWPADPALMLAGAAYAHTLEPRDAWIALFDPRVPRFLPGAMRIGHGIPSKLVRDGQRIWISLPWEGSVARVSARTSP